MSYIINKTDGTVLTEVVDGTINQTASDITLVAKNASAYGEFLNENFVHILENFANSSAPNHPIEGQLWYDTGEGRLKVYDGNGFKVSGGTIVSNTIPSTIAQGDIWIDSTRQQMYFNDGVSTLLAGPVYTKQQGISGFQTIDIIDTNVISHTILLLYVAQTLIGIFSKDAFTPASSIPGFTGSISVGFNASNYNGIKFKVPVSQADTLIAADSTLKTADSFVSTTNDSASTGTLSILNSTPLILGLNQNIEVLVDTSNVSINSNISNQNFGINLLNSSGLLNSLFINAQTQFVGLYTDTPQATLDVNGDTIVRGSLTVNGNLTTINTTNIQIEDKLIEIGKTDTPSNATADGGGISLKAGGDGDKTLKWVSSTAAWTSSENINVLAGKSYYVNGFQVLSQTSLGTTITSAPGLTSIGTQTVFQAGYLLVQNNTITYSRTGYSNGDVVLVPIGTGSVSVSNKKITNLADPSSSTDAVNLETLLLNVQTAPLGLSINVGILTDSQIASTIIQKIYPAVEHQASTVCRVWCIDTASGKQFTLVSGAWSFTANI